MSIMGNSKEEITALKDAVRIEQVIGTYVQLENKTGGNYLGLCPFHDDTSPSMHVHTEKQIFKCFACNEGGDVIAFISKIKSCSFAGAVNLLRREWCNGSVPPAQHTLRRDEYITPNVPLVSLTNVPDISLLNVPLFTGCN